VGILNGLVGRNRPGRVHLRTPGYWGFLLTASTDLTGPMGTLDHVGFVVDNVEDYLRRLSRIARVSVREIIEPHQFQTENRVLRGKPAFWMARAAFGELGGVPLELIQPLEGESIWHEHLQKYGSGLHHLGYRVEDLETEIQRMGTLGISVVQQAHNVGRSVWAYLDTVSQLGIILELRQIDQVG
jgi:methylmalonyl-CoA/ethylmalonyl-CoA epimerase